MGFWGIVGKATLCTAEAIGTLVVSNYQIAQQALAKKQQEKEIEEETYRQLKSIAIHPANGMRRDGYSFNVKLAGTSKENRAQYIKELPVRPSLLAIREKDNIHDSNAIAIYAGIHKIGYIPSDTAMKISPKIDNGKGMDVEISSIDNVDSRYPKVMLKIYMDSDYNPSPRNYTSDYDYETYEPDYHEIEVDDDIRDYQVAREEDGYFY